MEDKPFSFCSFKPPTRAVSSRYLPAMLLDRLSRGGVPPPRDQARNPRRTKRSLEAAFQKP